MGDNQPAQDSQKQPPVYPVFNWQLAAHESQGIYQYRSG